MKFQLDGNSKVYDAAGVLVTPRAEWFDPVSGHCGVAGKPVPYETARGDRGEVRGIGTLLDAPAPLYAVDAADKIHSFPPADQLAVVVDYANWRGERRPRHILPFPSGMRFGSTEHHPGPAQWLVAALDVETGRRRDFAASGMGWAADAASTASMMLIMGVPRSSAWPRVRAAHLAEFPSCAACGCKTARLLNVHHVLPFHLHPEIELDRGNLMTLCESASHNCHFTLGHLLDWKAYNPMAREDAARLLVAIQHRFYKVIEP